ncbi:uncharacterized protein LOC104417797 [Eucalyptus grandis]|uniref:Uncharacterized protein n=3 Tax=Eucalyptus TaxID=3932 RepID=A0ACC3LM19_EUCGR|nr:uncharacterized protein LOC104417797 [Eucalyptus grandis]KAK3439895.1 hypothetical protein EUGRSUZ_B00231 [Eucalyptus grandis]
MMKKKSIKRKWAAIAMVTYLLFMVDLLPSLTSASFLPAQHVLDALGGSKEGKTGSPRKALGGGFKLKGAIGLDSYVDFGKKKNRKAVESRSLRESPIVSLPSPQADVPRHHPSPRLI